MNRTARNVLAAGLVITASLLYVRQRFLVIEWSYAVGARRAEKDRLEQERQALTLEVATLKSPDRVRRVAKKRLGLESAPASSTLIRVGEDVSP